MIMFSHRLLQTFFLVPVFLSLLAAGAPVPSPQPTQHASSHDPHHGAHVQQAHTASPNVHPGAVTAHNVGQHGHIAGTIAVHPSKQHAMTPADLHAHVDHAQTVLALTHPNHEIHASHSPGDTHVTYHATPAHHVANEHTQGPAQHAVHHPGPQPHDAPHKDGVMTLDQRNAISRGLYNKLIRNQPDGRPGGNQHYNVGYVPGHPGEHGRGIAGTIPIAHDGLRNGMTPGELHMHADWVNRALVGAPHQDKVHVHVTHNPGDSHVSFHATPAQNKDILHPDHQHDRTINPYERGQLKNFLNHAGNQHYAAPSITGNNPNQRTFHGTIPAHTTGQMTTAHLDEYAKHAKEQLVAQHGIPAHEAANMVVATTHKAGDNIVHFHTQPKTNALLDRLSNDATQFPQLNQALTNAGHMRGNTGKTWHHAELGALRDSLTSKGATAATFDQHIAGHVIGVAGMGDLPCAACHNTLAQLPVKYTNMDRDTHPGIQRAV